MNQITILLVYMFKMTRLKQINLFCVLFPLFSPHVLNRLGSHLSPSGTECYITSDMFYVEVQLDTNGQLVDVKVAHQGENPTVSLLSLPYGPLIQMVLQKMLTTLLICN